MLGLYMARNLTRFENPPAVDNKKFLMREIFLLVGEIGPWIFACR